MTCVLRVKIICTIARQTPFTDGVRVRLAHQFHENFDTEYFNLQVETTSSTGVVKIPIAVLKVGEARTSMVNLEFPEAPVTFKLIEGAGPVYIHGNIISAYVEHAEEVEDECMELIVSFRFEF